MHRQFLISQISEQRAELAELDRQSPQEAERSTVGGEHRQARGKRRQRCRCAAQRRSNEYYKSAALWLC
jgi:hypothetical protein